VEVEWDKKLCIQQEKISQMRQPNDFSHQIPTFALQVREDGGGQAAAKGILCSVPKTPAK
jgi:hypothetical protein